MMDSFSKAHGFVQQEDQNDLYSLDLEVWLLPVLGIFFDVGMRSKAFLGDENYFGAVAVL